ncbi:MAG: ATP-binding protein [Actinomycetota bacterium]|nr:ATP-binding protein [Actinomycetota bacterium]
MDERESRALDASVEFRLLYENAPLPYQSLDSDGNIIAVNPAWLEGLGYSAEEAIGRWFGDFLAEDQVPKFRERFPHFKEAGETHGADFAMRRKDGAHVRWMANGRIAHNDDGSFRQTHCIFVDVTCERAAEERAAVINRIARIFMKGTDAEAHSAVLKEILEATGSEIGALGHIDRDGNSIVPTFAGDVWDGCGVAAKSIVYLRDEWGAATWAECLRDGLSRFSNEPARVPDGHIPVKCHAVVAIKDHGEVIGQISVANRPDGYDEQVVALLESIAESVGPVLRAQLERGWRERDLEEAVRELEQVKGSLEHIIEERTSDLRGSIDELVQALHAKDEFLASMSHELRTPLNSIIGFSGVMLKGLTGELSEEQLRQLDMVNRAGVHLLAIVDDMLDLSKIETGHMRLVPEEFDINVLIQDAVEPFRASLDEKGVKLTVHECAAPAVVFTDRGRAGQILYNLLSNAAKFTTAGGIDIDAECSEDGVVFRIADSGAGIAANQQNAIFERYYQIRTPEVGKPTGTGLGLSVSRLLAQVLGGDLVLVHSEPGIGSLFELRIPAQLPDSEGI